MITDIFIDKHLHTGFDKPIKKHFSKYFDTVFISFSPFFKLNGDKVKDRKFQKSSAITFDELKNEVDIFKDIPQINANIFTYQNDKYPDDNEILSGGVEVKWEEIKKGCNFDEIRDVNKALKTSIGAYRPVFASAEFSKRLVEFTNSNQIFIPIEGHFDVFSKVKIYESLKLLGKFSMIVEDEFYENKKEFSIEGMSVKEFIKIIGFKDYYIYDKDKTILFSVGWDDFFFLICSTNEIVDKIVKEIGFEGIYCDEDTDAGWEMTKEEIEEGWKKEGKVNIETTVNKKPWWKFW